MLTASLILLPVSASEDPSPLQLKTATTHPMQYYIALPEGWTADKEWPVVVVIESANRQFRDYASEFVRARGKRPFIVLAPLVVSNGGPNYRGAPGYHYPESAWAGMERVGTCRFDMDGVAAVASDVRKLYRGESKFFLTGLEAGGHTVWSITFQHPEWLRAAAPSGPNYAGRCLDAASFSKSPTRADLPVKVFQGTADRANPAHHFLDAQWERARKDAEAHGYRNIARARASEATWRAGRRRFGVLYFDR
jgi:poly(3-hydroxybutyrate) depolymerase